MITFFFKDKHSNEFNLALENASRGLLPSLRPSSYIINGRHGTVDFGNETYDTRQITVDIVFISLNTEDLQKLAREIAYWLSGSGMLIFSDEPDKSYQAKVYDAVDTEQLIRAKKCSITFECQPFAQSINYNQIDELKAHNGKNIIVNSIGTQKTPCRIIIRNVGTVNINNIEITRKAGN